MSKQVQVGRTNAHTLLPSSGGQSAGAWRHTWVPLPCRWLCCVQHCLPVAKGKGHKPPQGGFVTHLASNVYMQAPGLQNRC